MMELTSRTGIQNSIINKATWLQTRTRLEKKLIIATTVVGVVIFGFVIEAVTRHVPDVVEICDTRTCIKTSAQILTQIDPRTNPCDDFFKFACGKKADATHHKNVPSELLKAQVDKQLINILQGPINEDDHPALNDEKKLYAACVNEATNGTSIALVKSILAELNGWPVLLGTSWNEDNFKWWETTGRLKQQGLTYSMMFRAFFEEDPLNMPAKVIRLRSVTIMDWSVKHDYMIKKIMIKTAVSFGADATSASEEMAQAFQFLNKLEELSLMVVDQRQILNNTRFTIAEIQERYPTVNWLDYFQTVLQPVNITDEDSIVIPHSDFMDHFFDLLNKTSKRIIANYMFWSSIEGLMPLLSDDLLELHQQFYCLEYEQKTERTEECRKAVGKIFSPIPSYVTYANKYVSESAQKEIKAIVKYVVREFKYLLTSATWMNATSKKKATEWLDSINTIIAVPEQNITNIFANYTKGNKIVGNAFLETYLNAKKRNDIKRFQDQSPTAKKQYGIMYYLTSRTGILYIRSENAMLLPTGFLQGTNYNENRPWYLNFATLGTAIAAAISYAFTHTASLKLNMESEIWSAETQEIFENRTSCIKHNSVEFGKQGVNIRSVKFFYKQLKMAEINGLRLAYTAYKTWVVDHHEERHLVALDYTPYQLFWIWAFANVCFDVVDDTFANLHIDNEVVRQNMNFAGDFECDLGSKMNPVDKCMIF